MSKIKDSDIRMNCPDKATCYEHLHNLEVLKAYRKECKLSKKYKECLQEIRAIAEKLMSDNLCNNCDGIGLDANCQDTGCPYYQMDNILQKITKAEEE